MFWNAIAGGMIGYVHHGAYAAQVKAGNDVSKANADAGNLVRGAKNELASAQGNLQRWVQSLQNNRKLDAGGQAMEANMVNYRRQDDLLSQGAFEQSIAEAEASGAAAAMQALSGVTGDVVDMVNGATALRHARVNERNLVRREGMAFDAAHRQGTMMSQMVQGLDSSIIVDSIDYGVDVSQYTPTKSRLASMLYGAASAMGHNPDSTAGVDPSSQQKSGNVWSASIRAGGSGDYGGDGKADSYQQIDYSKYTSNREPVGLSIDGYAYDNPQSFKFNLGSDDSKGYRLGGD